MTKWLQHVIESYVPTSGGALELIHPAFLVLTVVISAFILADARRCGWLWHFVAAWTAGALWWPQIVVPFYAAWRLWARREAQPIRYVVPLLYLTVALGILGGWLYRAYHTVEAHLARAQQYRVLNQHEQAARELRLALALENNPHTHNLLGQELMTLKHWTDALYEFETATRGGASDPLLPFRTGEALYRLNRRAEAREWYRKFRAASCSGPDELTEPCANAREVSTRSGSDGP